MGIRLFKLTILFTALFCFSSLVAVSQIRTSNEVVVIKGKNYILHQVEKNQTLYSISKVYNIEQSTLLDENPSIREGLRIGEVLKIPQNQTTQKKSRSSRKRKKKKDEKIQPTETHFYHRVQKKETVYSIAHQYNVTPDIIFNENPKARKKIRTGQILLIPRKISEEKVIEEATSVETPKEDDRYSYHKVQAGETLYSISNKYGIEIESFIKENPSAVFSLTPGMTVKIPKTKTVGKEKDYFKYTSPGSFFSYRVMSGDTYFGLKKRYGIEQEELKNLNPQLNDGLKAGMVISIPKKQISATNIVPVDKNKFVYHEVEKGETLYGLSNLYNVKISAIKELNPVLKVRGPVAGESLLILKKQPEAVVYDDDDKEHLTVPERIDKEKIYQIKSNPELIPPDCFLSSSENSGKHYNVALFLPLFLEANDTINTIKLTKEEILKEIIKQRGNGIANPTVNPVKVRDPKILYKRSVNFVHFYEGILLALEEIENRGINIKLHVFDTNLDPYVVEQQVLSSNFLSFDLIIGPVYGKCQEYVSALSAKNRIPMVSPLSADKSFTLQNPYYFQIKPDKEYKLNATSEFISDDFFSQNFIVMNMGNNAHLDEIGVVDKVREKFFSSGFYGDASNVLFHEFNFDEGGYFGLERLMDPYRENVVIVPVSNEADISKAITNLNTASKKFNVTYLAVNYETSNYKSIEIEYLHNLKMHYLAPYYVDYNRENVIRFIKRYRKEFHTEPDPFSFQGYDVAWYFLNALGKLGNNFINCLPYFKVDLLQSDYNFQKVSNFGGYMNNTLFMMEYTSDYEVNSTGKVGDQPVIINNMERSPAYHRFWDGIDPKNRMER